MKSNNCIVGIYVRLSRDDERAGESLSIENQKSLLVRYVNEKGWILHDIYVDDGISGTTFERETFFAIAFTSFCDSYDTSQSLTLIYAWENYNIPAPTFRRRGNCSLSQR